MIKIDDEIIELGEFPDKTMLIKYEPTVHQKLGYAQIIWNYEDDREFVALMYLIKHLQANDVKDIHLYMPYIPNARMDRVKNPGDVFTLKYFAELLNSLNLSHVAVLDPHSSVSEALINNLHVVSPMEYIERVIANLPVTCRVYENPMTLETKQVFSLMMFYPDEGAMKRYANMVQLPYAFGIKKRNWETGKIEGLDVAGAVDQISGKDILIVDDICSRGGTFLNSAKKLKELGAKDIYLYVTHCENTILEGELLEGDLIKKVYTTDSIFTKSHEKVEVLK